MCVLAGFVGDQPAAPILLDMLRREEGLGGGYYTGVATIHEGRLHYAKVVGDVATLVAETDAQQLPGTVGIAHSRTKSGGDREWAHPFVHDERGLAYVANGFMGVFADTTDKVGAGNALLRAGYRFPSAAPEPIGTYPVLEDGACVHMSDVMCRRYVSVWMTLEPCPPPWPGPSWTCRRRSWAWPWWPLSRTACVQRASTCPWWLGGMHGPPTPPAPPWLSPGRLPGGCPCRPTARPASAGTTWKPGPSPTRPSR